MAAYFLILAIVTTLVILLGAKTSLLKDTSTSPKPPFSLARTQLAFWTVIVFSSFVYLLFKNPHDIPEINNVNLILLGIAVGTTATGKLIDDSQKNKTQLSQNFASQGLLIDLTSDMNGVSIHRLQNVLWTLAVGVIYIQYVAAQSSLPDETVLTTNLMILMGISTGAYVGLKTMENAS